MIDGRRGQISQHDIMTGRGVRGLGGNQPVAGIYTIFNLTVGRAVRLPGNGRAGGSDIRNIDAADNQGNRGRNHGAVVGGQNRGGRQHGAAQTKHTEKQTAFHNVFRFCSSSTTKAIIITPAIIATIIIVQLMEPPDF